MKILLGMSGGLDSSYAARLLMEEGHEVEGAFLLMHGTGELDAARASAAELGIPLRTVDCRPAFFEEVITPFAAAYRRGMTPNPCLICNERIKFKYLYDEMCRGGFDRIATGHYARIREENGRYAVCLAKDGKKDQSYVLYRLSQEVLSHLIFPLAEWEKTAVREAARDMAAAPRPESMEICFIPEGDHAAYIARHFGEAPEGDFVDADGRPLGRHRGILHYTVGQRKGLGIALGERMFVTRIEPKTNRIFLAPDRDRSVSSFTASSLVFSGIFPRTEGEDDFFVRLRYGAPLVRAHVVFSPDRVSVTLPESVRAITPGQGAVFYREGCVAFGGEIDPFDCIP